MEISAIIPRTVWQPVAFARTILTAIGVALGIAALSGLASAASAPKPTRNAAEVARGRYLVQDVSLCAECHTPRGPNHLPDQTRLLAGGWLPFGPHRSGPHWAAYAPELAGLKGLPGWSEAEWITFLHTGKTPSGVPSRPPMPAFRFSKEDAAAVVAYLKSLGASSGAKAVRLETGAAQPR